jgi:hypothetical protein
MDNIQRFFQTISPWEAAYENNIGLSYFAIRKENVLNLIQCRLFLNTYPPNITLTKFESRQVLAGYFPLSKIGMDHHDLISQLSSNGRIKTPVGELVLPVEAEHRLTSKFVPFHQEGIRNGNRLTVLTLAGAGWDSYIQQPDIDWELKAAPEPFDTLDELLLEYFLGGPRSEFASIEIIAMNVAVIALDSRVDGEEASPSILLAKALDSNKCNIGYRIFSQGRVVSRGSINGSKLEWSEQDALRRGMGKLAVPAGAVLHCVASYDGFAQHQGWIADPKNFQNPRRASLEEFDDKLEVLRDFLFEEQKPRKEPRDFEFGVAWLMWMLGFSVAQAGGTSRTSDAPDIIATTPKGDIAIVECTTGLLKAENKLAKLVERTELVRKRIAASGASHLKLLPVIVTARTKDEIRADLDQAKTLGVVVVTKETLIDALSRTIVAVDADIIYEQALESIKPQQEQLGVLPS